MKFLGKEISIGNKDMIAFKNISGAFLVKGFSLIISFISLPLYIKYFNNDLILGVWFTLLSILTWLLTFDFGIGNGLRNRLVKAISIDDKRLVKTYISSSYAYLGILVIIFAILITPVIYFLNWGDILNISSNDINSRILLIVILLNYITVLLQFFLRLISFILYSLQKSAINNLLTLITSLSQFLFILVYSGKDTTSNLLVLTLVHMICVILPLAVVTITTFSKHLRYAVPNIKFVDFKTGKSIISLGGKFFWIQIMYLGITGTNAFFITNIIGPSEVVEFQIYYRVYTLIAMLITLALTPFWSLITKAKVEKDWLWIKKYFKLIPLLLFFVILGQLVIFLMNDIIFDVWLGEAYIQVNYLYAISFVLFGTMYSFQAVISTFANGFNKIKPQLVVFTFGLIVKVVLIYGFRGLITNWSAIVFIDVSIFLIYCCIDYYLIFRYVSLKSRLLE